VRLLHHRRMSSTVAWKEPVRTITEPRSAKRSDPHHFSAEPESFSKSRVATRAFVGHIDADRHLPSQIRHAYVAEMRRLAENNYNSIGRYAHEIGQSKGRVGNVLRGKAIMHLEDIALAYRPLSVGVPVLSPGDGVR